MTLALLLGAAFGAALYFLVLTLAPQRRDLAAAVGRWEAGQARVPARAGVSTGQQMGEKIAAWVSQECSKRGITFTGVRPDLELLGISLETHLAKKLLYAVAGFLIPSVTVTVLNLAGFGLPWAAPAVLGLFFAVGLFVLPDATVKAKATQRRDDLRRALSSYLDLVSMAMASGRSVPQALPTAARIGTGDSFGLIARTIANARQRDMTPWAALTELGERTKMQELRDLGGALTLVADDGAKVKSSLAARATTLRRRRLAEAEGAAQKANETMSMCSVLLATTFVLFLGYPAAMTILAL